MKKVLLLGADGHVAARVANGLRAVVTILMSYDYEDSLRVINERELGEIDIIIFADKMDSDEQVLALAKIVQARHHTAVCYADTGRPSLDEELVRWSYCVGFISPDESLTGFIKEHNLVNSTVT